MKIFSFVLCCLLSVNLFAYDVVKDGGADPTGVNFSDAAFLLAAKNTKDTYKAVDTPDGRSGFSDLIYIPSGKYKLSGPIIGWGPMVRIRSERATIQQTANDKTFVFNVATKLNIDSLQFIGGTNAIWITNGNINGSEFKIRDCNFTSVTDYAIKTEEHLSAIMTIGECQFNMCGGAVYNTCDFVNVHDSWANGFRGESCFCNIRGRLFDMNNVTMVPMEPTAPNKYWVNCHNNATFTKCTFGGEAGGNPILRISGLNGQSYPFQGTTVVFNKCQLSGGPANNACSCIVSIDDNSMFQLLKFTECTHMVDVPVVKTGATLAQTLLSVTKKELISLEFESCKSWPLLNITTPNSRIPSELFPYCKVR